ncbi:lysozyme-like [Stegodyphus dumicola]|uniref:lysozyme-like n=1 Tax=Stegodyphus dumicola TaxID=202533 RepID=UPI0015ABF8D7|nr:lysozyme-like [Stegodyphus dumicola]
MDRCVAITLCCILTATVVSAQRRVKPPVVKVPEVDQRCLDCICQASSNCDETLKCHNAGGDAYFCGPYVISWAYWHDGGRPGDKGRAHDFETCLNNKTCAEEAVRGYMRKYGQDCDGSGNIDCFDFARIHKLGFGACGGNAIHNSDYWEKFEICYAGYNPGDQGGYGTGNLGGYAAGGQPDYDYGDTVLQARNAHMT